MRLSEIIKNYRAAQSLSMDGFAKAAGLSKPYISMLEKEKNSNGGKPIVPSLRTLQKIAAAMNLRLDELMKRMDGEETVSLAPLPAAEEPPKNADLLLERELLESYRRCKEPRRANIREYAEDQATRQEEDDIKEAQARFIKKKEIS